VCLCVCTGADSLGLEVQNVVDISDQVNCELAMRISSNIKNGDDFYTDLNGLQVRNIYVCLLKEWVLIDSCTAIIS
jgi:alpha-mannosidase II